MNENNEIEIQSTLEEPVKEDYIPKGKLESLLYSVYKNKSLSEILHILSYVVVFFTAYALFWHILDTIKDSPLDVIPIFITTGIPFIAVSVMRCFINAPRPYELFDFYEKKPKEKKGKSFPSRHVFSIFVIATILFRWNIFVGIGLIAGGILLAVVRVLLGIHFIRDVVAGALIGIICGIIGMLVI